MIDNEGMKNCTLEDGTESDDPLIEDFLIFDLSAPFSTNFTIF
jgi:hypothetical protein